MPHIPNRLDKQTHEDSNGWRRLGTGRTMRRATYATWARVTEDDKIVYNVTVASPPPHTDGGYPNLRSILALKGIVQHSYTGQCHGAKAD